MGCIDTELLVVYCEGRVKDRLTVWAIRQHLARCEECQDKEQFCLELQSAQREAGCFEE